MYSYVQEACSDIGSSDYSRPYTLGSKVKSQLTKGKFLEELKVWRCGVNR